MINEETLTHLINLIRHSSEVEFTIPARLVTDNGNPKTKKIQKKMSEINEAYEYFNIHPDYETKETLDLDIDRVKLKVKVIQ